MGKSNRQKGGEIMNKEQKACKHRWQHKVERGKSRGGDMRNWLIANGVSNVSVNGQNLNVNQIEEVIKMYKEKGSGTNQAVMEIGMPSDIKLIDPPCLRLIDTRLRYGKLHFILYFRSWDLWGGFPSNLGGLQLVKQYMAEEIGVDDGEIIAVSKGLHLYDYAWELAMLRTNKKRDFTVKHV